MCTIAKTMSKTLLLLLFLPAAASAHGGGPHLMGTVKAVDDHSITITDKDNKDATATVDDKTTFENSGQKATVKDVKAGERAVVHTRKAEDGKLTAVMVKFGKPTGAPEHHGPHAHGEHHDDAPAK